MYKVNIQELQVGDILFFKYGNDKLFHAIGVEIVEVKKVNKKTATIQGLGRNFGNFNKLDENGEIKNKNEFYTRRLIDYDEYLELSNYIKINNDWYRFKEDIKNMNFSIDTMEKILKVWREIK